MSRLEESQISENPLDGMASEYPLFKGGDASSDAILISEMDSVLEALEEACDSRRSIVVEVAMRDSRRFNQSAWLGQNLLGKCLMKVRTSLREETSTGMMKS